MKIRYNAAARAVRLVTLLLEEVCSSRNSILLKTRLVYIGIGEFRSTKQIAYTFDRTSSEVFGYVYRYFISTVCLTSKVRKKARLTFETVDGKLGENSAFRAAKYKGLRARRCISQNFWINISLCFGIIISCPFIYNTRVWSQYNVFLYKITKTQVKYVQKRVCAFYFFEIIMMRLLKNVLSKFRNLDNETLNKKHAKFSLL